MSGHLVVAVDDEADNLSLLSRALRKFEVHTFTDPREALKQVPSLKPSALLLDYKMPHLTGIGLLKALRETGVMAPALMVTAFPAEDEVLAAEHDGLIYQIMEKPFKPKDLEGLLECALLEAIENEP